MSTAQRVLVAYGTLSIAYGMALGLPLSRIRTGQATGPHHLVVAHLAALMQGPVHLGLSVALGLSTLTAAVETAAAVLLVCGSALFVGGATANWLQGVGDHFAERSPGWYLLAVSGPLHIAGALVMLTGVTAALV